MKVFYFEINHLFWGTKGFIFSSFFVAKSVVVYLFLDYVYLMSNPVKIARVCMYVCMCMYIYIYTYIFPNTYNVASQTDHTVTCFSDCKTCHVDY